MSVCPQVKSDPTKFSGKKSKATAKKGVSVYQYQILQKSDIPDAEIPAFRVPSHWLEYFPPTAVRDMKAMGCGLFKTLLYCREATKHCKDFHCSIFESSRPA